MIKYEINNRLQVIKIILLVLVFPCSALTLSDSQFNKLSSWEIPITILIDDELLDLDNDLETIFNYYNDRNRISGIYFNSDNEYDFRSGELVKNIYRFKGYPAVELKETILWNENPLNDPSWVWALHSLQFVDGLILEYEEEPQSWILDRLKNLPYNWLKFNLVENPPSWEFSWYDHTIPKRIHQILKIWDFLKKNNSLSSDFVYNALRFLYLHAQILTYENSIYIINHNHGLDQDYNLYKVSQYFPEFEKSKDWQDVSLNRLEKQIDFALSEDGVHVENSPGYHDWISGYIYEIVKTAENFNHSFENIDTSFVLTNGSKFSTSMIRPDGFYVQLGDTGSSKNRGFAKPGLTYWGTSEGDSLDYNNFLFARSRGFFGEKPYLTRFIFEKSGYFSYRNNWDYNLESEMHLIFKCGFLSQGHRHQDDNSIVLYALGEDWLLDSGMFNYNASRFRSYVLSHEGHNISYPLNVRNNNSILDRQKRPDWGIISANKELTDIIGNSYMYLGYQYQREIEIIDELSFNISDSISSIKLESSSIEKNKEVFVSRFILPFDKQLFQDLENGKIYIKSQETNNYMEIEYPRDLEVSSLDEINEDYISGITSDNKTLIPAKTLLFYKNSSNYSVNFKLSLKTNFSDLNQSNLVTVKNGELYKKNSIYVVEKINENIYKIKVNIFSNEKIAYYKYLNGNLVEKIGYINDSSFNLFFSKLGQYQITCFVADKDLTYRDDNKIIFNLPDFNISSNFYQVDEIRKNVWKFDFNIDPQKSSIAYYLLSENNDIIFRSNYFNSNLLIIDLSNQSLSLLPFYKNGNYRIQIFISDKSLLYNDPNKLFFELGESLDVR